VARKGIFITFEGVEGAGKTMQIRRLVSDLKNRGHAVILTREPGGTVISEEIRKILLDSSHRCMTAKAELLLYAAARAQHVEELILPALAQGRTVISDRFADATDAYQGHGRGLDPTLIQRLNRISTGGLVPDLTFVLDLPVQVGLARVRRGRSAMDRVEREDISFHERVRDGYLTIANRESQRMVVVNTHRGAKYVHEEIKTEVYKRLRDAKTHI
jgi:dTMP kinase